MRRKLGNMEMAQATTNEHFPFNAVIVLRVTNGPSEETLKTLLDYMPPPVGCSYSKGKEPLFFCIGRDTGDTDKGSGTAK